MEQIFLNKPFRWSDIMRLACVCCFVGCAGCYNLDVEHSMAFRGPNGSLFGYSVSLHSHGNQKWILVGAPVANSTFNPSIANPGAVYRCNIKNTSEDCEQLSMGSEKEVPCGRTCQAERDNQWFGVSLSRQPQTDGYIVACGHRWKNVFYTHGDHQNKLPHGVCYKIQPDLNSSSQPMTPCYKDHQRKFGDNYGSCQAGMSNFLMEDLIVIGAPGSFYWTGSVLVYNTSDNTLHAYVDDENVVLYGSYLGYSVGAGHFIHPQGTEVVGGAPQHGQTGKAYIFTFKSKYLSIVFEASGKKLGSYFGSSVCAVDLNSDGLSDLLVGAPMYSTVREEGRVYIYMNLGNADMKELDFELVGSDSYSARFGETITNLGDIDDDGFPDVAIGAPQEDDLQGAIYIYNGRKKGISQSYSQRITGNINGNVFKMFGQSVSGGIDVDGNGYPDVAVGAFMSDSAVVLRTRVVVIVEASLILPPSVNRTKPECVENGQPAVCMNITLCFKIKGRDIPGHIGFLYNLTADVHRKAGFPSRFYFIGNGTSNCTSGKVEASHNRVNCVTHQAFMRKEIRDIFTPIQFEAAYQLGEHVVKRDAPSLFPPLRPILQQREEEENHVRNKIQFARYCAWENCSTNLHVSAKLGLPQIHENKPYFALGNGKTVMLNVTLYNAGDDAFQASLHLRFPETLYFVKVLDSEEKHISCEIAEDDQSVVGLDCSIGHLYINSLTKTDVTFLLDVNKDSVPEDLNITVNATCESAEGADLLHDNIATLILPLRYGVDLNVHGLVSPSSFVFEEMQDESDCFTKKFNYTFTVVNVGFSKAPGSRLEINIPNSIAPRPFKLFNVLDIKTSLGECYLPNNTKDCDIPDTSFIEDVVFFFSKTTSRQLYCVKDDSSCLNIFCDFGEMETRMEATVQLQLELTPLVLALGRTSIFYIETIADAFPKQDTYVIELQKYQFASIILEAHHDQKPVRRVELSIVVVSLFVGLCILLLLIYILWKVGFFKRHLQKKQEHRKSWDYVNKTKDVY
ncbi:integrin alpha-4-like isoform X1 [Huso huso]|uniref:Integrin alpha-4-like isoform X1 n=1 Tax=Huso huso TaxID=61971 RepID=A0ABR0ZED7_HUSHU